jgi:hypothetical protein
MTYKDIEKQRQYCRDYQREKRAWFLTEVLCHVKCSECGESDYRVIDFHHLDPKTKVFAVSKLLRRTGDKIKILDEVAKCIPICANCHRRLHWKE